MRECLQGKLCLAVVFTLLTACAANEGATEAESDYRVVADYGDAVGFARDTGTTIQLLLTDAQLDREFLSARVNLSTSVLTIDYGAEMGGEQTLSEAGIHEASYYTDLLYSIHRSQTGEALPEAIPYTRYDCGDQSACIGGDRTRGCTNDCTPIGYCNGIGGYHLRCRQHDICYIRANCDSSSWMPWVGSLACDRCNGDAVSGFAVDSIMGTGIPSPYYYEAGDCTGPDGTCTESDEMNATATGELYTH